MDRSKLLSLVSTRAAAGIAVLALVAGTGSAVVLTTKPTSTHQTQTVVGDEHSTASTSDETTESADATSENSSDSSSTSNHGDAVTAAVAACKSSTAAAGTHGIGDCVSKVASSNGQSHRHSSASTTSSSH